MPDGWGPLEQVPERMGSLEQVPEGVGSLEQVQVPPVVQQATFCAGDFRTESQKLSTF
jgi:hypothetical protein